MTTQQIDLYAVVGNPVAHSKSPRIHRLFAEQTGQVLQYVPMLVEIGHFDEAVSEFARKGARGLNVTVPFKQDAFAFADEHSNRAQRAEAVNTLVLRADGHVFGDNTDGAGLVRDLSVNHAITLTGKRLLVLGAGGAVQGVLGPLLDEHPATLMIANRTEARAHALCDKFSAQGTVSASGFAGLAGQQYDVIINGTAAGLDNTVPPIPDDVLAPGGVCYDMFYADKPTAFVTWGQAHDAGASLDGLGMLVEQAAESFLLWRGVRPETAPVIAALRPRATG